MECNGKCYWVGDVDGGSFVEEEHIDPDCPKHGQQGGGVAAATAQGASPPTSPPPTSEGWELLGASMEVKRLHERINALEAENAALREALEEASVDADGGCLFCGVNPHHPDCYIGRALLRRYQ